MLLMLLGNYRETKLSKLMISLDEIKKIASLSRLDLRDEDTQSVHEKLSSVLENFEALQEVDTTNVTPFFHAKEKMHPRLDCAEQALSNEELMKNSPDHFESCFRIAKVVDSGEG